MSPHDDDKITSSVSGAERILCKQGYESHIFNLGNCIWTCDDSIWKWDQSGRHPLPSVFPAIVLIGVSTISQWTSAHSCHTPVSDPLSLSLLCGSQNAILMIEIRSYHPPAWLPTLRPKLFTLLCMSCLHWHQLPLPSHL